MIPNRTNYDQNWLPNVFNDILDNVWVPRTNATAPAVNVIEDEEAYVVEVAVPGMSKEDFSICLSDEDYITISVEKKEKKNEEDKKYLRREFLYSKFQQTLELPEDVDKEKISATVQNGVLTINLQKKASGAKNEQPRMIEIN